MYKIIITDFENNILDKQHYLKQPTSQDLDKAFFKAVKEFKTFIFVRIETVKYGEL